MRCAGPSAGVREISISEIIGQDEDDVRLVCSVRGANRKYEPDDGTKEIPKQHARLHTITISHVQ